MKKIILITALISFNTNATETEVTAQVTVEKSGKIMSGLVGDVAVLKTKTSKLEQAKTTCRVVVASRHTTSASWADSSKARCEDHEYATGGGCNSNTGQGGTGMVMQNGVKPVGYQCLVNQAATDRITAQAICCSFN